MVPFHLLSSTLAMQSSNYEYYLGTFAKEFLYIP